MKSHRLAIVVLCLSLVVAVTMDVARAQTPVPKPGMTPIQVAGTVHHVKGSVETGSCPASLAGMTLKVIEYWYAAGDGNMRSLVLPAQGATLDKLMFTGHELVQGHVLGTTTLTGAGAFDVQWSEVATAARKPWAVNVQNQRTGAIITVYRLLRLEVSGGVNLAVFTKTPPLIQFFGTETTKDVGVVTINCTPMG